MHADPATGIIDTETVWNGGPDGGATGGGVRKVFALSAWQASVGVPTSPSGAPGRGCPMWPQTLTLSPATGFWLPAKETVVGGTSAVAQLWAALTCQMAQAAHPLGLMQRKLYEGVNSGIPASGFRGRHQFPMPLAVTGACAPGALVLSHADSQASKDGRSETPGGDP